MRSSLCSLHNSNSLPSSNTRHCYFQLSKSCLIVESNNRWLTECSAFFATDELSSSEAYTPPVSVFPRAKTVMCHFYVRRQPAAALQNQEAAAAACQTFQHQCACVHVANESHDTSRPTALWGPFFLFRGSRRRVLDGVSWTSRSRVAWTPDEISRWITSAELFYFIMYGYCAMAARVVDQGQPGAEGVATAAAD